MARGHPSQGQPLRCARAHHRMASLPRLLGARRHVSPASFPLGALQDSSGRGRPLTSSATTGTLPDLAWYQCASSQRATAHTLSRLHIGLPTPRDCATLHAAIQSLNIHHVSAALTVLTHPIGAHPAQHGRTPAASGPRRVARGTQRNGPTQDRPFLLHRHILLPPPAPPPPPIDNLDDSATRILSVCFNRTPHAATVMLDSEGSTRGLDVGTVYRAARIRCALACISGGPHCANERNSCVAS